jgi:NAD(P)-dependent dehydrogenase (short-subunit alcohol dehydrogenase family)
MLAFNNGIYMKTILITGASSGIGKISAQFLAKQGFTVYGTSRRPQPESKEDQIKYIEMDVTSSESINRAVLKVIEETGAIDVLINNAGIGIGGSIEDTTIEEAKSQFETNYFGTLRVCQAVLPFMRQREEGQIINISSIGGRIALPFQAHYCASKFAIEGLTETLKLEVSRYNIKVSMIEPGDFKTNFTANRVLAEKANESSPYYSQMTTSLGIMEKDEQNGPSPIIIAKLMHKMINQKSPPLRVSVGMFIQKFGIFLKHLLPQRVFEFIMRITYKI